MKLIDVLERTEPSTLIKLHNKDLLNFVTAPADLLLNGTGFDCYHDREVIGVNPGWWLIDPAPQIAPALLVTIDY